MTEKMLIKSLTIKGFLSIKNLEEFPLNALNVLIGSNGAGKSNFIAYFKMLNELIESRLQYWTSVRGSPDRILSFGIKNTNILESIVSFGLYDYIFQLEPAMDGSFIFTKENLKFKNSAARNTIVNFRSGQKESKLKEQFDKEGEKSFFASCYHSISNWKIYHFHDTGDKALMKWPGAVHDNAYLRHDASNLAAYLYRLANETPETYEKIRQTVQLAIPFFDNFLLKPQTLNTGEELINLQWQQQNNDYPFWPSQLSDGSLRFICLATALLQPEPPTTIIIDEPELGLHPYAIALLASMLRSASKKMQVIVSTQSVPLVNEFEIEDLIVVEREKGASIFNRLKNKDYKDWLKEYTVGELWDKNILGGRPSHD